MKCKNCGREIPANSRKCPYCKSAVQVSTYDTSEFKWMPYDYPNPQKTNDVVVDWKNGKILDKNAGMIYDQAVNGWIEPENLNDLFSFDDIVESRQKSLDSELARANSKNADSGRRLHGMNAPRSRSSNPDEFSDLLDDDYIEGFLESLHGISGDIYGTGDTFRMSSSFAQPSRESASQTQSQTPSSPYQAQDYARASDFSYQTPDQSQASGFSYQTQDQSQASDFAQKSANQSPEFAWSSQITNIAQQGTDNQGSVSFDIPSFAAEPYAANLDFVKESSAHAVSDGGQTPSNAANTMNTASTASAVSIANAADTANAANTVNTVNTASTMNAADSADAANAANTVNDTDTAGLANVYSDIEYDPSTGTFRLIELNASDTEAAPVASTAAVSKSSPAEHTASPAASSATPSAETHISHSEASYDPVSVKASDIQDRSASDIPSNPAPSKIASGGLTSFGLMFDEIIASENDFIEKLNIAEKADVDMSSDNKPAAMSSDNKAVDISSDNKPAENDIKASGKSNSKVSGDDDSDKSDAPKTITMDENAAAADSTAAQQARSAVSFKSISDRYDDFLSGAAQDNKSTPEKKNVEININEPSGTAVTVKTIETPAQDPDGGSENLKTRKVNLKNIKKAQKNLEMTVEVSATNRDASVKVTRTPDGSTVVKTSDAPGFGRVYVNGEEIENNSDADSYINVTSSTNEDDSSSILDEAVADAIKAVGAARSKKAAQSASDTPDTQSSSDALAADNAVDKTDASASDNAADKADASTSDNAADKTDASASDNAADKADASTSDNAADKTDASASDNAADKADASTSDNAADKTDASASDNAADKADASTSDTAIDKADASTSDTAADKTPEYAASAAGVDDKAPAIEIAPKEAASPDDTSIIAEATAAEEVIQTEDNAVANGLASAEAAQHTMNIPELTADSLSDKLLKAKQTLSEIDSSLEDDFDSLDDFWNKKTDSKKMTITDIFGENAHEVMEKGISGAAESLDNAKETDKSETASRSESTDDAKKSDGKDSVARKSSGNTFMDIMRADIMPSKSQTTAIVMPTIDPDAERGLKTEVISDERKAEMEQELSALDDLNKGKERRFGFGKKKKKQSKSDNEKSAKVSDEKPIQTVDAESKEFDDAANKDKNNISADDNSKAKSVKTKPDSRGSKPDIKITKDRQESQNISDGVPKDEAPVKNVKTRKKAGAKVKRPQRSYYDELDDYDLEEESIGPVAKIIAIILCILLIAEFAIIGIKLLAPESGVASVIVKIEESVSNIFSSEETGTKALSAPDTSSEILLLTDGSDTSEISFF